MWENVLRERQQNSQGFQDIQASRYMWPVRAEYFWL